MGFEFHGFLGQERASESIRSAKSRTSVFASRRSTSDGSLSFGASPKSTEIVENSHRKRFSIMLHGKYSILSLPDVPWNRFWPLRPAPGRSWALSLAFLGAFVDSLSARGAHRGLPETLPRRSRDVPKIRSGRSWRSRGVLRASRERFGSLLHSIASPWLAQSGCQRQPQRQPQRND